MVHKYLRSIAAVAAATAVAASVAISAPATAAPDISDPITLLPPGFPCIHTNVYPVPVLDWGWRPIDGEAPRYIEAEGGKGRGYLDLYTTPGGRTNFFHIGISTPLSDLLGPESLGFLHSGQTAFQLRITRAESIGDLSGFTTLVWEPAYNNNAGLNGWVDSNDLARGRWWSTKPIAGLENRDTWLTLDQISALNPRAQVLDYGVSVGTAGSQAILGTADDIRYGCARWDFEPFRFGS
ncbi:UNVERIFIED_CONTAM: hypothetical protein DES50_10454 [Williamsia faeni]